MHVLVVFGNDGGLLFIPLHDYVNVRVCNLHNPHHTGHIENYKKHTANLPLVAFFSFTLSSCSIFRLTNTGWMVVCTFRLRSLSCFLTISVEIWSLNGKTTRIVSSVS